MAISESFSLTCQLVKSHYSRTSLTLSIHRYLPLPRTPHHPFYDEAALGSDYKPHERICQRCDRPRKPRPLIFANTIIIVNLNTQELGLTLFERRLSFLVILATAETLQVYGMQFAFFFVSFLHTSSTSYDEHFR
jgi:hypothetical protein